MIEEALPKDKNPLEGMALVATENLNGAIIMYKFVAVDEAERVVEEIKNAI